MDKLKDKGEIYMITNLINNKKYIGQAVCWTGKNKQKRHGTEQRWNKHLWSAKSGEMRCPALSNALLKYGESNFQIKTIHICDVSQLNYFETKFQRLYNTITPNGYNIRSVSSKGRHHSDSIEKISKAKSGENHHMFGKKHSEETKKKMGEAISKARKKGNYPKYLYKFKDGYYIKHHPNLTFQRKYFNIGKTSTDEEAYSKAIEYLNKLK